LLTPKEKAKDRRLWKNYRWTLEMYNRLGELQGWKCAGCGKHVSEKSLNLDHYHFKIKLNKLSGYSDGDFKWFAETEIDGKLFSSNGRTQKIARQKLKDQALPVSVRGLLCAGRHGLGCNTKLGRIDYPDWLRTMATYLENPPARQILLDKRESS